MKRSRLAVLLFLALCAPLVGCKEDGKSAEQEFLENLLLSSILQPPGEYWARIYRVDPLANTDTNNINFVRLAVPSDVNAGRKNVVLVSGWDVNDRSDFAYPGEDVLRKRALSTSWGTFISSVQFAALVGSGYDFYIFDYLTSDTVDVNGARFRARLDAVFGGAANDSVFIYAHSMGGLVSRFALYQGAARPAYLKRLISNGTPYHGSPWASAEFQATAGALGAIATFLTQTAGGQDLRWDNFDNSLAGSSNPRLTEINARKDRDIYIHAIFSQVPGGTTFAGDASPESIVVTGCPLLNAFAPHDCVVPVSSQTLSGTTLAGTSNFGNYDHISQDLRNNTTRNSFVTLINSL